MYIIRRHTRNPEEGIRAAVCRAALARFLPSLTKTAFEKALSDAGIVDDATERRTDSSWRERLVAAGQSRETGVEEDTRVPEILFYDNKQVSSFELRSIAEFQHLQVMDDMAKDFELGSHLLLIGNQGVGKNKITDRFLQLINRPRQYMQLHR